MGSACCVASRDKTIQNGPGSEIFHRNVRYSPSWSFRWENRGRVAGEEVSLSWLSDGISRNDGSDIKYESAFGSEEGSPSESFRTRRWQKSPLSEETAGLARTPASDQSISRNTSMDVSLEQVKESTESPAASHPSPMKLSLSLPSTSSLSTSPLSSKCHLQPGSSTRPATPRWLRSSPRHHLLRQVSDVQMPELKSPARNSAIEERPAVPSWSNESTRGSQGGSSDGWSMHAFSELMASSHRDRWSFDNDPFGFNGEKMTRYGSQILASPSVDLQSCGACSKLLSEKSFWSSQKIFANNELSVVAVLTCGHVYHAECLENMTPEIDKYDPTCPVCTFGSRKTLRLSEKALRAEMEMKVRNRISRNRVVDSDLDINSVAFDRLKGSRHEGRGPKLASSSSTKSSAARPFLRSHFSFGSKGSRSPINNQPSRKKGFFWTRSGKI
ncbi:uncharacterized protein LOC110810448 [Carica papaya]|uniref:uncharacterized protein LOC110810448 n=1 Tax=Carica papaya TaxID=3649 RepID=UPI000B8C9950|nr:uncharacterized protein LOC110810448 [Carica papaya]XP_021892336.1 uncharacterized protein LOC110810448 [Carica papaya]XP_021892337.1 uncharacterized protein LOC110810448 [Carica papaya]XP_021892338.1 uncharacterized protein LOC110810448 [Carica papaya]